MNNNKSVLVFTGGGETPVLNATLYGIISEAKKNSFRVFGGIGGWDCLLDKGKIHDLTNHDIEGVHEIGGTFLRTSRTNPYKIKGALEQLKTNLDKQGIDYIVPVGGDDTLSVARKLFEEENVKVIGAPKTADNDINGTYFCPGFPSAAYNTINFIRRIRRDCAIPRKRIFIIESQGGNAGWLPSSAILGNADIITIPEQKVELNHFLKLVKKYYDEKGYCVVVVSKESNFDVDLGKDEEQNDSFSVKRRHNLAFDLRKIVFEKFGIETQALYPGNYVRAGKGFHLDIEMSIQVGKKCIDLIQKNEFGYMSSIVNENGKILAGKTKLSEAVGNGKYKSMAGSMYDNEKLLPSNEYVGYLKSIVGELEDKDGWYHELLKGLE